VRSQRVLVVDDSRTVRRIVARALVEAGYDVVLASDGREGLERATAHAPDLVLTDFVMPQMNGLRFIQSLRAIQNLANVPVVLMSAKADRIAESFVTQTGAFDAITKPFSPEALLAVTTHVLARAAVEAMPLPVSEGERPSAPIVTPSVAPALPSEDPARKNAAERAARAIATLVNAAHPSVATDETIAAAIMRHADTEVMLAWVADLAAIVPEVTGEHALDGLIEHVPLGDVFELLRHQRQTGTLEIDGGAHVVSVCFSRGAIDLAIERPSREEFRIGRYAVEEGLVDAAELERIATTRTGTRQLLGTHLMKMGFLRQEDLTRLLTRQTSELVYEALRWRRGRYRFARLRTRPEASLARLGVPVGSIVMEGLRRVDEWRLVEEQVRSFDDVFRPDTDAIARADRSRLSREERLVLDAVDGERSVRAIVQHVRMGSFEVGKILFALVTSRLVRR
jgi:DNA-binding response OmpR family regulator